MNWISYNVCDKFFLKKVKSCFSSCNTSVFFLNLCLMQLASCAKPTAYDQVVEYYAHDSLKHEAAIFLQKYSKYHYGIARNILDANGKPSTLSPKMFATDTIYRAYLDSLHYQLKKGDPVMDEDTVTEEYLVKNIEMAFDSWNKPWAKNLSFDEFCHYILPYRNGDEDLSDWRSYLKQKYEHLITDSLMQNANTKDLAEFMMRQIRKNVKYGTQFNRLIQGFLTPKETEKLGALECKACANYATMVMRACGIPCEVIEMRWRFTEVPHSSVLFPKTANNPRPFRLTIGDSLTYMGEPKDTMATYRTWAYTYEVNKDLMDLARDKDVPRKFWQPLFRNDVTSLMCTTSDMQLPVPDSLKIKNYLFLCRFDNWEWYPIREGKVMEDSVVFKNATIRQLYRLGYAKDGKVKTFGGLFTLLGNGKVKEFDQTGEVLRFKMPYFCDTTETRLFRKITTYCWTPNHKWKAYVRNAPLWGFNQKTGEYKRFDESMRGAFVPVFHLCEMDMPAWTVFYNNEMGRPIGFVRIDKATNEGELMDF